MTLSLFVQYAAINFFILLIVIVLSFAIKAWFDQRTFRKNAFYANIMLDYNLSKMLDGTKEEEFDRHVQTTPGMQNF